MIKFAIVGAGWRSETYLRIASLLSNMEVVGVVARREEVARGLASKWSVPTFATISELHAHTKPSFVVASVSPESIPTVCLELAKAGMPILAETPPATDLATLESTYLRLTKLNARVQVAEQFWAQPLHAARLAVLSSGKLGRVDQVHLSVCHGYHAMSLIRLFLGIDFESPLISGKIFPGRVIAGPDRKGPPEREHIVDVETEHAVLEFGDRVGVYEFCLPQYRSWIRGQRVCIRGERGEIIDENVTYLKDEVTPITHRLVRHEGGRNGNHEGLHLKAIQCGEDWVYRNPVGAAPLSDEELAIAKCLLEMQVHLESGHSFYSLEQACQDQYLALAVQEAMKTKQTVQTKRQIWAQ